MKRHVILSSLEMSCFLQNYLTFTSEPKHSMRLTGICTPESGFRGCGHSRTLKQGLGLRALSSWKTNIFLKVRGKVPHESLKEASETSFLVGLARSHS